MRCLYLALALVAAPVIPLLVWAAAPTPNFSGTWELNASKSQAEPGRMITYTIEDASPKINFKRVVRDTNGKEETSQFSCDVGGSQCDFDEAGRKAKVSLWYNGPALVILKTDGPKEDSVTQWKLDLSPDGKTLTVEFTHIEPNDKSESLVFDKKSS